MGTGKSADSGWFHAGIIPSRSSRNSPILLPIRTSETKVQRNDTVQYETASSTLVSISYYSLDRAGTHEDFLLFSDKLTPGHE